MSKLDLQPTLAALLPPREVERLCASLVVLLDSPVALQDLGGDILGGARGLPEQSRVELVLEIEPVGYLLAPQALPVTRAAVANLIHQLLTARARYLMAAEIHLVSTQTDYEELQRQHAALKASEAKYKALSAELELRVAAQVKVIDERQRQLYQAERLASVGQLAAGVAHEINNPIGFVRSNLGSGQKYLDQIARLGSVVKTLPGGEAVWASADMDFLCADFAELLRDSLDGVDRVARIVNDLKGFSNVDKPQEEVVDVTELLTTACNIIEKRLLPGATLSRQITPARPLLCLPGHLSQAFLAVLTNALQAIAPRGELGRITVNSRPIGKFLSISIHDNGDGIPGEAMPKVFDPFFTTRPVGQGTGLGLTVTRDILRTHGGDIELDCPPEGGTVVTLKVPE